MRALRVSGPAQLDLPLPGGSSEQCWTGLPADARAAVLALLARLIARGVIAEGELTDPGDG